MQYCKSFLPYVKKPNGYFEEINGNKYLTLALINGRKEKIKKA